MDRFKIYSGTELAITFRQPIRVPGDIKKQRSLNCVLAFNTALTMFKEWSIVEEHSDELPDLNKDFNTFLSKSYDFRVFRMKHLSWLNKINIKTSSLREVTPNSHSWMLFYVVVCQYLKVILTAIQ